jgi:hypothetical protein
MLGGLHYDVNRVVPLGITMQQNNVTTKPMHRSMSASATTPSPAG